MSEVAKKETVDNEFAAARKQIADSSAAWSGGMTAATALGIALAIICTLALVYVRLIR